MTIKHIYPQIIIPTSLNSDSIIFLHFFYSKILYNNNTSFPITAMQPTFFI